MFILISWGVFCLPKSHLAECFWSSSQKIQSTREFIIKQIINAWKLDVLGLLFLSFPYLWKKGLKRYCFCSIIFALFRTRCESPGDRTWPFDYKSTPEVMMGVLTTDDPWLSLWLLKCFVTCNIKIKQAKDVYPGTCPTWQNCGHGGQLLLKLQVFIVS